MSRLVQLSMSCQFKIHFTSEKEHNNILPFLDVLFIRDGDNFNATVYRKDVHNVSKLELV